MSRRHTLFLPLALALLAAPLTAEGQPAGKLYRIGVLSPFSSSFGPSPSNSFEAFRQRLRELGYVEEKNLAFEYRWAEGRYDRLPNLAADLVRLKVDVIFAAWTTPVALAAKAAAATIVPVVFAGSGDAVGVGLVDSLARPGGNITGSTFISQETIGKQLQLLKEAVPRIVRVGILSNPANPVYGPVLKDVEAMARALNMEARRLGVRDSTELGHAFEAATRERIEGLVVLRDPVFTTNRTRLLELAAKNRLPAMYGLREFVDAGGLMSYEPNLAEIFRRAADLVDKILKGRNPSDLPVEQVMRFDLVINMQTAKALGITFPQSIAIQATEAIE